MGVGIAVGEDVEDDFEVLVDATELEVLLGATVPRGEQTVPRSAGSLNVSANVPLVTPYLVPTAEAMVELPL